MTSTSFDPGAVRLRLRWQAGSATGFDLRVERPAVATIMRGRQADQAVRSIPLLYSICSAAQAAAAQLALQAARGMAQEPVIDDGVRTEAMREHLWRLLLDWPRMLGLQLQERLLAEARRRLADADFQAWMAAELSGPFEQIEAAARALPAFAAADGSPFLPPLAAAETVALWPRLDAAFAAAPMYCGAAAETGALARHDEITGAAPLAARIRARIADLHESNGLGRVSAAPVATGVGRAAVETARGLLVHEITLDGERIAEYVIVAPTEWNFHPHGRLRAWLANSEAATPEALRALAAQAVLALDPCVRCAIDIDA